MKDEDLLYWIALTQVPGVGPVIAKTMISYCGSPYEVFRHSRARLTRIPGIGEITAAAVSAFRDFKRAEAELEFISKHELKAWPYTDAQYPYRLKEAEDSPIIIYYLGNADLNAKRVIGIVGTRKATSYGKEFTEKLLEGLAPYGCLVISGLAYGIDVHAHRATLQQGLQTVGVLAHGLHTLYPPAHKTIAKKMIQQGGLLTEFLSGQDADKENFPKRNRIVAGLCDALIVVETALKGGAMITAELAAGYNRDVYAMPGRLNDPWSAGCNHLIKINKAALIESAADVAYLSGWENPGQGNKVKASKLVVHNLTIEEQAIMNAFQGKEKTGIDELCFRLQTDGSRIALLLLDMEFRGIIRSLPGKYYQLAS